MKAYEHFNDPEWDGEPLEPEPSGLGSPRGEPKEPPSEPPNTGGDEPRERLVIKLADGKERHFQHMSATTFWDASGKPISATQFVEELFGKLPELFRDEDELRTIWSQPDTRAALVAGLAERGFDGEQLTSVRRMIDGEDSDLFDVLRYIAFTKLPLKRAERAAARRTSILSRYDAKQQAFLDFVLSQYVAEGEDELDTGKLPDLLDLKYGSPTDAIRELGSVSDIRTTFTGFQRGLYEGDDDLK